MTAAAEARDYARRLIGAEAGGGGIEPAIHRVEARTGIGFWPLRALWHGRPKEVTADLYFRLRSAYLALCERQVSALQHELAIEAARGNHELDADLAAEADRLAAKVKTARGR